MNPEQLQRTQDMLTAMQMQRDNALNAMVHAQAELAALRRELAAKDEQIVKLSTTPEVAKAA